MKRESKQENITFFTIKYLSAFNKEARCATVYSLNGKCMPSVREDCRMTSCFP